jgi:hypothetical protein
VQTLTALLLPVGRPTEQEARAYFPQLTSARCSTRLRIGDFVAAELLAIVTVKEGSKHECKGPWRQRLLLGAADSGATATEATGSHWTQPATQRLYDRTPKHRLGIAIVGSRQPSD